MKTYQVLYQEAKAKNQAALDLLRGDNPDMDAVQALRSEATALTAQADAIKAVEADMKAARQPEPAADLPTDVPAQPAANDMSAVSKAAYVIQYGNVDEDVSKIMNEVYGTRDDYRQVSYNQMKGFARFMRTGVAGEGVDKRQLWPAEAVKTMIRQGMSVDEIKATQMESSDVLGGYAVPAMVTDRIITRQAGLSSVRQAGATLLNLTTNSIEMLSVTGGNSRYTAGLRGAWGNETKSPDSKNFNVGMEQLTTHVYTYKVPFSVSLLQDATNIVDLFTNLVSQTMALDEDEAFLIGSGVGRPMGILPGSANTLSLIEQVSLAAATLTIEGLKKLRRTVASQYRGQNATIIGNSDTGGIIEALKDTNGNFYVDTLEQGTRFLNSTWRESEAMPTTGAGTYPLIYGDFSGYFIAERLGMAVQRYNDSNTGINVVEFHVRRRIGGKLLEPWKLGVQKVAAS